MKILFCSPLTFVGGISTWTSIILNYYNSHKTDTFKLRHLNVKSVINVCKNVSIVKRICAGFLMYVPLCRSINLALKHDNYDIVHLCSSASFGLFKDFIILRTCLKKQVRSVIHFHFGRIPQIYTKNNWETKLLDCVVKLASSVVVIDKQSYDTLCERGYKNVFYLPNPLNPKVTKIVSCNETCRDFKKILFVGHVTKSKGIIELIEACKTIQDIELYVVGLVSPEMRECLCKIAGEGHDSWLHITGELSYEDTIKEMLTAGVFVLPSYTEGFPYVILESMACGCPIVTTDVGAIPEMLDIVNGFNNGICVKPKDVNALNQALLTMLNNKTYALQCGHNAQQRVNALYSIPVIWENLQSIWVSTANLK